MIKVGIIGLGMMGRMHFNVLRGYDNVEIVAMCDIDPEKRSGGWLNVEGNIKDTRADKNVDLSNIKMYEDGFDLIKNDDIDYVVVTVPDYLHRKYAEAALKAGKDVMSEKPMAISLEDADAMLDAEAESGKFLFVGQCVRFFPSYVAAREIVKSKAYGKVQSAFFRRVGGAPKWSWENWYMDGQRSGGTLFDLHVHDIDYIQNVFGIPKEVSSRGTVDAVCNNGAVDHVFTNYMYPEGAIVTAQASWYTGTGYPFEMSFTIELERATLLYGPVTDGKLTIFLPDGTKQQPDLLPGDGYTREDEYFIECVARRTPPTLMPALEARNNIAIALAERESVLTGRHTTIEARTK